jgi:hypothetical protein
MRYNKDEAAMRIRNNEDAGAVGWRVCILIRMEELCGWSKWSL